MQNLMYHKKIKHKYIKERIIKSNGLTQCWTKTEKAVHYKTIFYRNTNMVSEFFSKPFLLFQISGSRLFHSDTIFFFFFLLFQISGMRHSFADIIFFWGF